MPLSARAIFHFTRKEEYLLDILEHRGFAPRYCLEDLSFAIPERFMEIVSKRYPLQQAIPMVCFCDIKLSQTEDHSSTYGKYAIGLTKHWGVQMGVAPVQYYHEGSFNLSFYNHIIQRVMQTIDAVNGVAKEQLTDALFSLFGMIAYMKPVEGEMLRDGKLVEKYFYDEREWRYTPIEFAINPDETDDVILQAISNNQFQNESFLENEHKKLRKDEYRLPFTEGDVKYIIVPETDDFPDFVEKLRSKAPRLDMDMLIHKIRSYEEIKEDYA